MKHITAKELEALKHALEQEKSDLEAELRQYGRRVGGDWQGTAQGFETEEPDDIDSADKMEELATNVPLVETLEARLRDVSSALDRMADGTYGIDEVTGEPIDPKRLHANPSARRNIA